VLQTGEEVIDTVILTSAVREGSCAIGWHRIHPAYQPEREDQLLQVFVRDKNIEQALRMLKKKMQREGVFREMRRRRFYEKPSEESARKKSDAVRRARKLARKEAIRDGLIAAPARKQAQERKQPGNSPRRA
jgi:small subunit ribosomal protein S21